MTSVGVIIPTHNSHLFTSRALSSALAQTRPPDRIVIVDDGSAAAFALDEQHRVAAGIEVIRLPVNKGAASARQAAIEALSTSHVAFLDSDDFWLPDKLERQIRLLEEGGARDHVAIACGWRYQFESGRTSQVIVPRATDRLADFVSGCWFCPGSTVLMARDLLLRIGGFDPRLRRLEDLDLFIRFGMHGGRLEIVPGDSAVITKGHNARRCDVESAARILRMQFSAQGSHPLPADCFRRLQSWLAVEEAAAAFNEAHWLTMVNRLVASFGLVPRPRLQLENWWQETT